MDENLVKLQPLAIHGVSNHALNIGVIGAVEAVTIGYIGEVK